MNLRRLAFALALSALPFAAQARVVRVPDTGIVFEIRDDGGERRVRLSKDGGLTWTRERAVDLTIPLRFGTLEPGRFLPSVPASFRSSPGNRLFLVQYETPALEAWRVILRRLGVEILAFVPNQAQIVRMDPALVPEVLAQPFVRWVGPYEPAYRVEPEILASVLAADRSEAPARYNLVVPTRGTAEKLLLADEIGSLGGSVDLLIPHGFRLEATLTLPQVEAIARSPHLLWIDRWSPPEEDMDIVREEDGANYVETVAGYAGQGVRGEVMDGGIQLDHPDFDGVLVHGGSPNVESHGTSTYGIVFGNGDRDGDGQAKGTGNLPEKEAGWFADYSYLTDRYQHTSEIVSAPIFGMFQSNSWGSSLTQSYNSISAEMDDIIWLYDLPIFQSQSNAGNRNSRPQAWAKNIVSVGAVDHYDTLTLADDCWCSTGSIGPAEDGRIKPDLAYWYDSIYTTTTGSGYTSGFGGTSAATPITAGIGGLILQMWGDDVLGNAPEGTTLFEKRPHAATLKAMMINTAEPYPFSGSTADLGRYHQGWGLASAKNFWDRRSLIQVIDQENALQELDTHVYTAVVPPSQDALKITMVYTDRAGTTSSTQHRINDVTLKVIDPSGSTTYWGNVGLTDGNWSIPGGSPDTKNTVENVFVQNPAAGSWTIEIEATELNQDEIQATPEVDQDYALVVYGTTALDFGCPVPPPSASDPAATPSGENAIALSWTGTPTARRYRIYRAAGGCGGTFSLLATVGKTETTFTDGAASGGLVYGYQVAAVESCEALPTTCVEATATGPCILPPSFAGAASATDENQSSCGVDVTWSPAAASCGGPIVYNVYRSTSPSFVPAAGNRVASCLSGTSFADHDGLVSNTPYFYVVRAEDLSGRGSAECGGSGEGNVASVTARPRGPMGNLVAEGFEAGLGGWTVVAGSPAASQGAWEAGVVAGSTDGGQPASPSTCPEGAQCLYTGKNKGGNPNNGDVDDGETIALSPVFDASAFSTAELTYRRWHFNSGTYNDNNDRFSFEVSRDGGSGWQALDSLGARASENAWTPKSFALETSGALTAQMRFRVRSADGINFDDVVESAVDDVRVVGFQACSSASVGAPGEVSSLSIGKDTESSKLVLSWSPDCAGEALGYSIYRGDLGAGWASAAPLPGFCGAASTTAYVDAGEGSFFFVVAPNAGGVEGSLGLDSTGGRRPRPAATCWPEAAPVAGCAP